MSASNVPSIGMENQNRNGLEKQEKNRGARKKKKETNFIIEQTTFTLHSRLFFSLSSLCFFPYFLLRIMKFIGFSWNKNRRKKGMKVRYAVTRIREFDYFVARRDTTTERYNLYGTWLDYFLTLIHFICTRKMKLFFLYFYPSRGYPE